MSHLQKLNTLETDCQSTNQCAEYNATLLQQERNLDNYTTQSNQSALLLGFVIAFIGLLILATPFVTLLQKVQKFILPKVLIISPIILGFLCGAFAGFIISFGQCFKQSCSTAESSSIFTIPLATLLITIPVSLYMFRKRHNIADKVSRINSGIWIVVGILIIIFAGLWTVSSVNDNARSSKSNKESLRTREL